MVARAMLGVCVSAVLAATGCAAADDGDTEESASALQWQQQPADDFQVPGPVDRPQFDVHRRLKRPVWDVKRYLEGDGEADFGHCYRYDVKIYDPGKGKYIPIPVTVCNP